jgi:hypothetical protein
MTKVGAVRDVVVGVMAVGELVPLGPDGNSATTHALAIQPDLADTVLSVRKTRS